MRPDVKLGIVISLVVVVVAGGYYIYRDSRDATIPVANSPGDLVKVVDTSKGKMDTGGNRGPRGHAGKKIAGKNGSAARAKQAPANRMAAGDNQDSARTGSKNPAPRVNRNAPAANTARRANDGRTVSESGTSNTPAQGSSGSPTETASGGLNGAASPGVAQVPANGPARSTEDAANSRRPAGNPLARSNSTPGAGARQAGGAGLTGRANSGAPDESPPAKSAGGASKIAVESHRLQPGDTLAGLAMAYYGSESHVGLLMDANPQIKDPTRLRVGMEIKIPAATDDRLASDAATVSRPSAQADSSADRRQYTVKPGDSFYAIAASQLGSSSRWEEVFELNKGLVKGDPKRLQVGQVIALPE